MITIIGDSYTNSIINFHMLKILSNCIFIVFIANFI